MQRVGELKRQSIFGDKEEGSQKEINVAATLCFSYLSCFQRF